MFLSLRERGYNLERLIGFLIEFVLCLKVFFNYIVLIVFCYLEQFFPG
jgi:hypothetical protein